MTCPACMQWCATSEKQLSTRMKNITGAPEVQAHPCPACGGTDWATTREMIQEEAPRSRLPSWLKPTPMWSAMLSLTLGVWCTAFAIFVGPSWLGLVNALVGGFNLAGGIYSFYLIRARQVMAEQQDMLNAILAMNTALLSDKVRMVIAHGMIGDDDDAPIAPDRLH